MVLNTIQRGEDCPPRYDNNIEEYLSDGEEFSYIFTSAGWVCYDMNQFKMIKNLKSLKSLLETLLFD